MNCLLEEIFDQISRRINIRVLFDKIILYGKKNLE
jgi:hypothetical protein